MKSFDRILQKSHGFLVKVCIVMGSHCDHGNCYKAKQLIRADLQFGGLIHYCHSEKHGTM